MATPNPNWGAFEPFTHRVRTAHSPSPEAIANAKARGIFLMPSLSYQTVTGTWARLDILNTYQCAVFCDDKGVWSWSTAADQQLDQGTAVDEISAKLAAEQSLYQHFAAGINELLNKDLTP